MRGWETEQLKTRGVNECPLRCEQHPDRKGASVTDVDWCIRKALAAADTQKATGGMATAGTESDPHLILLTGNGAGLTADDSGVRIAVVAGSVCGMNQSTHGVWNLIFYRASEHGEHWDTLMARSAGG
jgi:hypothetical protein